MGIEDWAMVIGPGTDIDQVLLAEATAAAPPGVVEGGKVLPRRKPENPECVFCGSTSEISREHIPPRSAGNSFAGWEHTAADWLERESLDDFGKKGSHIQGGVWGYVLCRTCNSRTSRLSAGYVEVAERAVGLLGQLPSVDVLNAEAHSRELSCVLKGVRPGLFVRQLLSHMLVLGSPWGLVGRHPELVDSVLNGTAVALPSQMSIGMVLCPGPYGLSSGPMLHIDSDLRRWRWFVELTHPPLGFEFVLASSDPAPFSPVTGMQGFLEVEESYRADISGNLCVGLKNTGFPGDWRTRTQIENRLNLDGTTQEPGLHNYSDDGTI